MVANTAENVAPGAVNSAAIAPGAVGSSQLASSINLSGTVSAGSFTGSGSGLTSVNAVTLGGLNSSSFAPSSGSASYIQNSTSQELGSFNLSGTGALGGSMTAASFSGSGSGLTNLSAANVSGTLSNATLPSPYTAALTFSNTVSFSNAQGTFTLLNSSSAPAAASSSNAGQLYFDSTKNALTYSDGTVWNTVPGQQLNYVQGYDNEFQYSFTNSTPVAATGRTLNFTKLHANTRLRITYSDNVGILSAGGGTPMASWEVVLDGSSIGPLKTTVYLVPNTNGILIPCHLEGYVPGISAGAHQIVVDVYPVNLSGGTTLQTMTGFKSSYLLQVEEIP